MMDELIFTYKQEKNTKHLLKYDNIKELIDTSLQKLKTQKKYLNDLKLKQRDSSSNNTDLEYINIPHLEYINIYEKDYEQVKFFVSQIIFLRLKKIMKYNENSDKLNSYEKSFLHEFRDLMDFTDKADLLKENDKKGEIVAFICLEDIGMYLIDNNEVNLKIGEFYVCLYEDIKELVDEGLIELV